MDNENQINEQPQQDSEVKESFNLFKMDGALSRSGFFIVFTIVLAYSIVFSFVFYYIYININPMEHKILYITILSIYGLSSIYIYGLSCAKRLYDIIGNKQKAIFYIVIAYISITATSFIPWIKYLGSALSLLLVGILFLKRGKLIK